MRSILSVVCHWKRDGETTTDHGFAAEPSAALDHMGVNEEHVYLEGVTGLEMRRASTRDVQFTMRTSPPADARDVDDHRWSGAW